MKLSAGEEMLMFTGNICKACKDSGLEDLERVTFLSSPAVVMDEVRHFVVLHAPMKFAKLMEIFCDNDKSKN